MNNTGNQFLLRIAGICAILAPFPLLAGDIMIVTGTWHFMWTICLWVSFVLFVPGIFGMTYLAAGGGRLVALIGGASAFFGAMAGASMQILFRVYAVLEELGSPQTIELLRGCKKLIATTQMIGIFFPLGLIILSIALFRSRTVSWYVPLALVGGAILFPMARIAGLTIGFFGGDLLLIIAFGVVGIRLLSSATDPEGESA